MNPNGEIESPRFLWVAALTIAVSEIAVLLVREAAIRILHPSPTFLPLAVVPPILDTFVCVVVAIFVFIRVSPDPSGVRSWRLLATVVLVVSFTPDVLVVRSRQMGGDWPEACALMIMHVVVWAICITLLPALAYSTSSSNTDRPHDTLSIL